MKSAKPKLLHLTVYTALLILLILTTDPSFSPLISLLFFLLVWRTLSVFLTIVVHIRYTETLRSNSHKMYYSTISQVAAFCMTLVMVFGSMHQLGVLDMVWCALLFVCARFYLQRTILASE